MFTINNTNKWGYCGEIIVIKKSPSESDYKIANDRPNVTDVVDQTNIDVVDGSLITKRSSV